MLGVDLYNTTHPARDQNGTHSAELYEQWTERMLRRHAAGGEAEGKPFFMYLAWQCTHAPEQARQRFLGLYPREWLTGRRQYAAMISAVDEGMGNLTSMLEETGL